MCFSCGASGSRTQEWCPHVPCVDTDGEVGGQEALARTCPCQSQPAVLSTQPDLTSAMQFSVNLYFFG